MNEQNPIGESQSEKEITSEEFLKQTQRLCEEGKIPDYKIESAEMLIKLLNDAQAGMKIEKGKFSNLVVMDFIFKPKERKLTPEEEEMNKNAAIFQRKIEKITEGEPNNFHIIRPNNGDSFDPYNMLCVGWEEVEDPSYDTRILKTSRAGFSANGKREMPASVIVGRYSKK